MVHQIQKNQTALLLLILAALIILTTIVFISAGTDNGIAISRAVEGGGAVYGTFERSVLPWAIDAERVMPVFVRF